MNIAIIPARGGSKRIPRKNIRHFHGKPIIAYSIEACLQSGLFDRVVVSTDDIEIANVAKSFGAEVPFLRPPEISDDFATTIDVLEHAIRALDNHQGDIQNVCCVYATAPFVKSDDLINAFEIMNKEKCDYVFSATSFPFPIQRAFRLNNQGTVDMFYPEHETSRSQDLEEAYHDAGQFYLGKKSAFLAKRPFFTSTSIPYILPRKRVQDIDTNDDWEYAELLFHLLKDESCKL